jgi:hypothetical protein
MYVTSTYTLLPNGLTSIYHKDMTGNEGGSLITKPYHSISNVLGLTYMPHWNPAISCSAKSGR